MDARGDLDIVPVAFKDVTLRCLCRSAGKSNQQCCWTMQIDDKEDKSMPENAVDDIGLEIWESSRMLCQYIQDNDSARRLIGSVPGILELGAGVGLPSMLCSALGAAAVTLTDYDPQVLEIERENLRLNGLSGRALHLDWRDRAAAPRLGTYDLILCCDLLYASTVIKDFVETVKLLLEPSGVLLFAHQIRRAITWDKRIGQPRLEESDAPLELFKAQAEQARLIRKELLLQEPAQPAKDMGTEGSFVILAFAWQQQALDLL